MDEVKLEKKEGKSFLTYTESYEELGFIEILLTNDFIKALHTEVKPEAGGKGIGKKLFNAFIDYARKNNLKVKSECSFVSAQLTRHAKDLKDVWES